jgi:hypothetical protein
MLKKIKKLVKGERSPKEGLLVERRDLVREHVEEQMVAATLAEAGLHRDAQDVIQAGLLARPKVLLVGREDRISDPVMHYAVGFAERMGYEIVALNVVPLPVGSSRTPAALEAIVREYEKSCSESVKKLQEMCAARGIPCTHVFKTGTVEDCVREIHDEMKRIEFVISEPDIPQEVMSRGEPWVVPVYSLAH